MVVVGVGAGAGCASRVMLVHPSTEVMKTAEEVRVRVFVFRDGQWVLSGNRVKIPPGYTVLYVGPEEGK
jgi:hypothetical protein